MARVTNAELLRRNGELERDLAGTCEELRKSRQELAALSQDMDQATLNYSDLYKEKQGVMRYSAQLESERAELRKECDMLRSEMAEAMLVIGRLVFDEMQRTD